MSVVLFAIHVHCINSKIFNSGRQERGGKISFPIVHIIGLAFRLEKGFNMLVYLT